MPGRGRSRGHGCGRGHGHGHERVGEGKWGGVVRPSEGSTFNVQTVEFWHVILKARALRERMNA